ncbi:MAG: hypothetical protein KA059_09350 [Elusimicrobiales bacterium]|nr:hypothetical protein [Elusimicrobiales bacterium]
MRKSFLIFLLSLSSCHTMNIDVIKTGHYFSPKKYTDIDLYPNSKSVKRQFGGIAIFKSDRFDCSVEKQESLLLKAKKMAADIGANGMIYYFDYGEKDPYAKPEEKCFLSAVAIKYLDAEVEEFLKNNQPSDTVSQ